VEVRAGDRPEEANKYVKRSPPRLPGFWGGIWCIGCCWEEASSQRSTKTNLVTKDCLSV
ncbi:hypothetical protein AVDCRST_MAG84-6321, partial [uncultured Microcoleus sp.]